MDLIEYLSAEDDELFIETEKIKKEVKPILENRLHLDYTDHSIEHSYRMLQQLGQIMFELMESEERLNKYELFILICSAYLHDIGMQFEKLDLLKGFGLNIKDEEKADENLELAFIRDNHHIISRIWIMESIKGNPNFRKVYFGHPELGELIALISESHNIDLKKNIDNLNDYMFHGCRIRLNLLACLLALGDALDADNRRVDIERLKHINIAEDSRLYWWGHCYISGLYYEKGLLNIQYTFPDLSSAEYDIYRMYFSSQVKYWISYNKENFKSILAKNHIRFEFNEVYQKSCVKQKLTQEDYRYIKNYVLSKQISPVENIRQRLSEKLGYQHIDVSEYKDSYIVTYKGETTKIVTIQKNLYDVNDLEKIVEAIINQIKR